MIQTSQKKPLSKKYAAAKKSIPRAAKRQRMAANEDDCGPAGRRNEALSASAADALQTAMRRSMTKSLREMELDMAGVETVSSAAMGQMVNAGNNDSDDDDHVKNYIGEEDQEVEEEEETEDEEDEEEEEEEERERKISKRISSRTPTRRSSNRSPRRIPGGSGMRNHYQRRADTVSCSLENEQTSVVANQKSAGSYARAGAPGSTAGLLGGNSRKEETDGELIPGCQFVRGEENKRSAKEDMSQLLVVVGEIFSRVKFGYEEKNLKREVIYFGGCARG